MHYGHTDEYSFICAGWTFENDPRGEIVSPTVVDVVGERQYQQHVGVQSRVYVWHVVSNLPKFTDLPACWMIA